MSDISNKMKARLQENQGISSDDISAVIAEQEAESSAPKAEPEENKTSTVVPEKPEQHDPAVAASVFELDNKNFFLGAIGLNGLGTQVEITPEEKNKFIDAIISNSRMKLSYSFFGGKVSFTIKNRTYEESRAAFMFAAKPIEGMPELKTSFAFRIRLLLMALQVDELNGVSYPDADTLGPLFPTMDGLKVVQPKWLSRVSVFDKLPEAVFEAIWQCLYEFESKYWVLVRHSRDQDFWLPE